MHKTTGSKLCLSKEDKDPFACLGLMTDFNGTDVTQNQTHAKPSCLNCVDRTMRTHGWESSSNSDNEHTVTPLRMDVLNQMANHTDGPKEGSENEVLVWNSAGGNDVCLHQLSTGHRVCHHSHVKMWFEPNRIPLQLSQIHSHHGLNIQDTISGLFLKGCNSTNESGPNGQQTHVISNKLLSFEPAHWSQAGLNVQA